MLDGSGKLKTDSFYFICDDNTHDTNFMYKIYYFQLFIKPLGSFRWSYFLDGFVEQYKIST